MMPRHSAACAYAPDEAADAATADSARALSFGMGVALAWCYAATLARKVCAALASAAPMHSRLGATKSAARSALARSAFARAPAKNPALPRRSPSWARSWATLRLLQHLIAASIVREATGRTAWRAFTTP